MHGDDEHLVDDIESQGRVFALVAGVSALVGGALAVAGRRGQGRAALVGLLALALLPWLAVLQPLGAPDFLVRSGYVLSTVSIAVVVGIRARLLVHLRTAAGSRTGWATAGICLLVVFLLVTSMVCISASLSFEPS